MDKIFKKLLEEKKIDILNTKHRDILIQVFEMPDPKSNIAIKLIIHFFMTLNFFKNQMNFEELFLKL